MRNTGIATPVPVKNWETPRSTKGQPASRWLVMLRPIRSRYSPKIGNAPEGMAGSNSNARTRSGTGTICTLAPTVSALVTGLFGKPVTGVTRCSVQRSVFRGGT